MIVNLKDISRYVEYNLYLVCMSRGHHKLFAYFKTGNILRNRQVIEKLKTPCRCIMICCSTEIKTRHTIFHDTAPTSASEYFTKHLNLARVVCRASLFNWRFQLCAESTTIYNVLLIIIISKDSFYQMSPGRSNFSCRCPRSTHQTQLN